MLNHEYRSEVHYVNADAFPITRTSPFAVYLLFRRILVGVWERSKEEYSTPTERLEHTLASGGVHFHDAGRRGAIVAMMMDTVNGAGKRAMGMVRPRLVV